MEFLLNLNNRVAASNDLISGLTIRFDKEDTYCSALPIMTCSSYGKNDYIHPKPQRSLVCPRTPKTMINFKLKSSDKNLFLPFVQLDISGMHP